MKKYIFLFFITILAASPACAAFSVFELNHACADTGEKSQDICRYYILGVTDGVGLETKLSADKRFCVPAGMRVEGLELLIKTALQRDLLAHPEDNTMPAVSFIAAVLLKTFPCHAQPKPAQATPPEVVPEAPPAADAAPQAKPDEAKPAGAPTPATSLPPIP